MQAAAATLHDWAFLLPPLCLAAALARYAVTSSGGGAPLAADRARGGLVALTALASVVVAMAVAAASPLGPPGAAFPQRMLTPFSQQPIAPAEASQLTAATSSVCSAASGSALGAVAAAVGVSAVGEAGAPAGRQLDVLSDHFAKAVRAPPAAEESRDTEIPGFPEALLLVGVAAGLLEVLLWSAATATWTMGPLLTSACGTVSCACRALGFRRKERPEGQSVRRTSQTMLSRCASRDVDVCREAHELAAHMQGVDVMPSQLHGNAITEGYHILPCPVCWSPQSELGLSSAERTLLQSISFSLSIYQRNQEQGCKEAAEYGPYATVLHLQQEFTCLFDDLLQSQSWRQAWTEHPSVCTVCV